MRRLEYMSEDKPKHNCDNETCVLLFSYRLHKSFLHISEVESIRYKWQEKTLPNMVITFKETMCPKTSLLKQSNMIIKGARAKHAYENLKGIEGVNWVS